MYTILIKIWQKSLLGGKLFLAVVTAGVGIVVSIAKVAKVCMTSACRTSQCTMVQNNQEFRCKYRAIRWSVRSFAWSA